MARERKVAPVLVHMEPSLHELMLAMCAQDDEDGSPFLRRLLIAEADERGLLSDELKRRLMGAAR